MTETIQTAMDRLMTTAAEPQDYIAEDGLLYCGSCNTPKEAFFPNGRMLFGRDRHPAECQCRQEAREKQEEEERATYVENEIEAFRQTKTENEKELVVVQEELQQKKQNAGNTEVLLTADNLQQYVKKIEVDHKKNTYTEFVF